MNDKLATAPAPGTALTRSESVGDLMQVFAFAEKLMAARDFIPQHLKTPGAVAAAILAGRELGIPPMLALRSIHVVSGKVGLAADLQLALMKRAGIRHTWLKDGSDRKRATLKLERAGDTPHEQTYTIEEASDAGLLRNPTWKAHTAAMLRARCVSAAAKAYCPDVVSGAYDPDELANMAPLPAPVVVDGSTGEVLREPSKPAPGPADELLNDLPHVAVTIEGAATWFRELESLDVPNSKKKPLYSAWGKLVKERHGKDPAAFADEIRNPPADTTAAPEIEGEVIP